MIEKDIEQMKKDLKEWAKIDREIVELLNKIYDKLAIRKKRYDEIYKELV